MAEKRVSVYDGKYIFVLKDDDYRVEILRHGEPWCILDAGSGAIRQLLDEFIEFKDSAGASKLPGPELIRRLTDRECVSILGMLKAWTMLCQFQIEVDKFVSDLKKKQGDEDSAWDDE